ncbi:hypothetical protein ILYODFUR_007884 [Ilyodon furcidens]|uniref:Uncharacterized protein n=1 Tax=Ilyodon furcidens TaxID=33524 RepID=A0ABV0T6H8_9TELE
MFCRKVLNISPGIIWVALPILLYCADIEALQVHLTKHPVGHHRKLQRSSPATSDTDSVSVNKNSQRPDLKETTEPTPSTHLPSICLVQQQTITSSQQHALMSSRRVEGRIYSTALDLCADVCRGNCDILLVAPAPTPALSFPSFHSGKFPGCRNSPAEGNVRSSCVCWCILSVHPGRTLFISSNLPQLVEPFSNAPL